MILTWLVPDQQSATSSLCVTIAVLQNIEPKLLLPLTVTT